LDTLATKILLCETESGGTPIAYGVQIAPGAALPVASNFQGKQHLKTKIITSDESLQLSGIGDREHLYQHGVQPIVHLPGVGTNLQDHDEVANIWSLKRNHPWLKFSTESGHQNLYSSLFMMMSKSLPTLPEPDVMIYWIPGYFSGFFHGFAGMVMWI
ncbi:hypothetical protein K438DRAFT_1607783, partial [Mycena galopus ATCC 62051]